MTDFIKYQALGNDYLVIDPQRSDFLPSPRAIRVLCDRHFGVGADGVLFGPLAQVPPGGPVELRIFNPDGSECEKSGNGIRMFALYLAERYCPGTSFTVRTKAGDSLVRLCDLQNGVVSVRMGRPVFGLDGPIGPDLREAELGHRLRVGGRELNTIVVNIGNPHAVLLMNSISRRLAEELGPQIARHRAFPHGTNVQLVRVIDRGAIEIEIWERGAGYTLASGSSSCAAASAVHAMGLVDDVVAVKMPGGTIGIEIAEDRAVTMTGTAEQVASGSFAPGFRVRLGLQPAVASRNASLAMGLRP